RFFWAVVYTLLAASVAIVARRCSSWRAGVVFLTAVTLQSADVAPVRGWGMTVSASGSGRNIAAANEWRKIISSHGRMTMLPSFACRGDVRGRVFQAILDLGFLASESLTPVSTTYLDRYRSPDCLEEAQQVFDREPAEGELLV